MTDKLINEAIKLMDHNNKERLDMVTKYMEGKMNKKEALEILDKQEQNANEAIAAVDRRIEELEKKLEPHRLTSAITEKLLHWPRWARRILLISIFGTMSSLLLWLALRLMAGN